MKIILLLSIIFITGNSFAQRLKKYPVSNSGCSVTSYCESNYEFKFSPDSSKVYTGECSSGDVIFGVICVKFFHSISDLTAAENLMISYVDHLKESFEIKKSAGYGKGYRLNNNENTRGILDYWEDKDSYKWKIKAWTNGEFIGFMYAYSNKELQEVKVNAFLDGFRLPGL